MDEMEKAFREFFGEVAEVFDHMFPQLPSVDPNWRQLELANGNMFEPFACLQRARRVLDMRDYDRKQRQREDAVLAEAEAIKSRRAAAGEAT